MTVFYGTLKQFNSTLAKIRIMPKLRFKNTPTNRHQFRKVPSSASGYFSADISTMTYSGASKQFNSTLANTRILSSSGS